MCVDYYYYLYSLLCLPFVAKKIYIFVIYLSHLTVKRPAFVQKCFMEVITLQTLDWGVTPQNPVTGNTDFPA